MQQITVRVPASTSNLGPGFDCLGIALQIYNCVTLARGGQVSSPLVNRAARLFFRRAAVKPFSFTCSISDEIPQARGLGSSATVRAGVLLGLNEMVKRPLDRLSIFHLCAELEGHPDNAAPAIFGGFTVGRGGAVQRFNVSPQLSFVLLVPGLEVKTAAARNILPARIALKEAVESCGNACTVTAAFASRNYGALSGAFSDKFHQPFRRKLIPFLPRVIAAAEEAGALGAFLSGSGSTIAAVTLKSSKRIAAAMLEAAPSKGARIIVTKADNHGAQFLETRSVERRPGRPRSRSGSGEGAGASESIRNPKSEIRNS
jgi:homoserine kinase